MFELISLIFGLIWGSFLGVVKSRLDDPKSIFIGRSKCPKCKTTLGVLDLVPIFSFIFSGGKCRYCKKPISSNYLVLEIIGALLAVGVYFYYGISSASIALFISLSFLLVASVADIEDQEVDVLFFILGIISAIIFAILSGGYSVVFILGAITYAVIPFFLYLISREKWMGLGDTFFALWAGILVGFPLSFIAVFLAFFIGALFGIIRLLTGAKSHQVAFGPFLAIGAVVALILSQTVLVQYPSLF